MTPKAVCRGSATQRHAPETTPFSERVGNGEKVQKRELYYYYYRSTARTVCVSWTSEYRPEAKAQSLVPLVAIVFYPGISTLVSYILW